MIYATVNVTIGDYQSTCDNTIVLYRGDKNVEIRFVLKGNKFTVLNSTYAQMIITRPSTTSVFSEIASIQNDTVILTISEGMIDELIEVGCYDMQIRLYDDSMKSRVTIPPAEKAIEVREPIAIDESFVDTAMVGYARAQTDSEDEEDKRFDENGNYIKTYWEHGDIITAGKLNKVEDSLETINANDIQNHIEVNEKIDALIESIDAAEYVTETELNAKGYLTEHQDISGLATKEYVDNAITNLNINIDIDYDSLLAFDTTEIITKPNYDDGSNYIDNDNNLILDDDLPAGIYTLKYGFEDGTYTDIKNFIIKNESSGDVMNLLEEGEIYLNKTVSRSTVSLKDFPGVVTIALPIDFDGKTQYALKIHNSPRSLKTYKDYNTLIFADVNMTTTSYVNGSTHFGYMNEGCWTVSDDGKSLGVCVFTPPADKQLMYVTFLIKYSGDDLTITEADLTGLLITLEKEGGNN